MEKGPLYRLLVRWVVCSLGLWIAAGLLVRRFTYESRIGVIIIAGLVLAIVNAIIRPILLFCPCRRFCSALACS